MTPTDERRILRNFVEMMPKTYRKRSPNWVLVRDLITKGTNHAGMTSAIQECYKIGIDPDGYEIKEEIQ